MTTLKIVKNENSFLVRDDSLPWCQVRLVEHEKYFKAVLGIFAQSGDSFGRKPPNPADAKKWKEAQVGGMPKLISKILRDPTFKGKELRIEAGTSFPIKGANAYYSCPEDKYDPEVEHENIYWDLNHEIRKEIFKKFNAKDPVQFITKDIEGTRYFCHGGPRKSMDSIISNSKERARSICKFIKFNIVSCHHPLIFCSPSLDIHWYSSSVCQGAGTGSTQ